MTLDQIWQQRSDITLVAVRAGHPGPYVSMAHESPQDAIAAADDQMFTAEDIIADDWSLAAAP